MSMNTEEISYSWCYHNTAVLYIYFSDVDVRCSLMESYWKRTSDFLHYAFHVDQA